MLEAITIITFAGLVLASQRYMEFWNPYQIYFTVWFTAFLGYYFTADLFIPVASHFLLLLLTVHLFALVQLIIIAQQKRGTQTRRNKQSFGGIYLKRVFILQLVALAVLPATYYKAVEMSGGENIFSVPGYMKLRLSMTGDDNADYGILAYAAILSYAVSSVSATAFHRGELGLLRLLMSVAVSLGYLYLSTGRTAILMFTIVVFGPFFVIGAVGRKGLIIASVFLLISFTLIAAMTSKGISVDANAADNASSFLKNIVGYTTAPLVALSKIVDSNIQLDWGANTFRFIIALQYKLGISSVSPIDLVRDFVSVPIETNVFTVYEVYFRDFSHIGFIIPPALLLVHYYLYNKARNTGGRWIFYYSASVYPLVMQFFQDQYFSLLSTWMQMYLIYWLLCRSADTALEVKGKDHA